MGGRGPYGDRRRARGDSRTRTSQPSGGFAPRPRRGSAPPIRGRWRPTGRPGRRRIAVPLVGGALSRRGGHSRGQRVVRFVRRYATRFSAQRRVAPRRPDRPRRPVPPRPLRRAPHRASRPGRTQRPASTPRLAVDVVPFDGDWSRTMQAARFFAWSPACAATGCAGQVRSPMRVVLYNGYPGDPAHCAPPGCSPHLHLSWAHAPTPPLTPAPWVEVLPTTSA